MSPEAASTDAVISKIVVTPMRIGRSRPVRFAHGALSYVDQVLIRVVTDMGVVGLGEAPARPAFYGETPSSIVGVLTGQIAPRLLGVSLDRPDVVRDVLRAIPANNCAKGGFEHAFWDARLKAMNVSYRDVFGGTGESVPASWLLGYGTYEEVLEALEEGREAYGFFSFKVKVGRDWRHEADVLLQLRETLGSEIRLHLDGNEAFAPPDALRLAEALKDADIDHFEEPCTPHAVTVRRRIQELMPVMSDEGTPTVEAAEYAIASGTSNMLNIKPARVGLSGARWLLEFAERHGVATMCGSQLETSIGSAATVLLSDSSALTRPRPIGAGVFKMLTTELAVEPLKLEGGRITPPTGPGFGMHLDEDALASAAGSQPEVVLTVDSRSR